LTRWRVAWPIWVGRLAFLIFLGHVAVAISRRVLRLPYETWLRVHTVGAFLLLGLPFVHSLALGRDFESRPTRILWAALPLAAGSSWLYGRLLRPWLMTRCSYQVVSVTSEAPRVWTLTLERSSNRAMNYAPGQFQFLRLRGSSVWTEEHPFSIASSPSPDGRISVTIKECGDFTATIGHVKSGDRATVHGPFGRFSHVYHPGDANLVFVAGGIGITPLMSMLRCMRDRAESRRVLLIYANRTVADIAFRRELESIEAAGCPALKTIHVLSQPPADWVGLSGRLDIAMLATLCDGLSNKMFFICCPPLMTSGLIGGLRKAGVAPQQIQTDYFAF
jgi:predicted ferric reductase